MEVYNSDGIQLFNGDCREVLAALPDHSVDAVVSDPPYGLSFMGKRWDYDVPSVEVWQQCLRVLKPGGHLLAFAGTRTQHRMACRIEDAGFEIRDMIAWVYGSGFPKSLDVSKAIDKAAGAEREVVGTRPLTGKARILSGADYNGGYSDEYRGSDKDYKEAYSITAPATEAAKQWQGWGTALKPSLEPITLARKPLEGTVAANVLQHGTGAINVDGCRLEGQHTYTPRLTSNANMNDDGWQRIGQSADSVTASGRWPANFIHDGSKEVTGLFPTTAPARSGNRGKGIDGPTFRHASGEEIGVRGHNDLGGSAARFFYCAKTSQSERGKGNNHPTVKPIDLMRYLCRMVTPPGGVVLDPFAGSGSTLLAARREGFRAIGIELSEEYCGIIRSRLGEPEEASSEVLEGQRTLF
jgi:DNA modification methylase